MKNLLIIFFALICMLPLQAQHFALGNDKFNIAYIGVDNPISIAVENCPCNSIILKVDNGTVTGENCKYIFRVNEVGVAHIKLYKKTVNHLKEVGQYAFRVKRIPPPVFKIGPYGVSYFYADRKARAVVLKSQQYVRAELEGFDFDARCLVDSFQVKIFHVDSAKTNTYFNTTNKISQQIIDAISELKNGDVIFFHKIFAKGPDGIQWELDPLILTIEN
jgi:hypothetical protein